MTKRLLNKQITQSVRKLSRGQFAAGVAAMSIPVLTLVGMHLNWMHTPEQKLKMASLHAGFWGGMTLGAYSVHNLLFWGKSTVTKAIGFGLGATLPLLGFYGAKRFSDYKLPDDETPKSQPLNIIDTNDEHLHLNAPATRQSQTQRPYSVQYQNYTGQYRYQPQYSPAIYRQPLY